MLKTVRNLTIIFIIVVILGFSLMVLSYTIPTDNAHENIVKDAPELYNIYQFVIPDYSTTRLDLYSDTIILSEVAYYNKNVSLLDNAMSVYGTREGEDFQKFIEGDTSVIHEYPRYWHGYLVVYKPLFNFLDLSAIKTLELFFELVMIISIIKLMNDNNLKNYIIPFLLSLFFIHPEVIGLCLQFSPMFNVTLISIYILLKFKDWLFKDNRLTYYFLVVGMATSFFDSSTFPLISFGIPIIFYMLLESDKNTLKNNLLKIVLYGFIWGIGFIGMWLSKLIISSIILNENVVDNALKQFVFRTSNVEFTRLDAILMNVLIYKKKSYLIIMGLIAIHYIKRLIDVREKIDINNIKQLTPLLVIAVTPFIWYFLVSNHSFVHYWLAYRELMIFFFAVMCFLEEIIRKKDIICKNF